MLTEHTNYRRYLKVALAEKCAQNPAYSLRAFARQAGVSPSHLSRVISGMKTLSSQMALKIASALDLQAQELEHFLDLVSLEVADQHTKKLLVDRILSRTKSTDARTLDMERFHLLADWYCLTLYELTQAKGFQSDPAWIARKLRVSLAEAKVAIDRLEQLELISVSEEGVITALEKTYLETSDDISSIAIRKHHEQISQKAIQALKEQSVDDREFQSVHFVFDEKQMAKAKKLIREFSVRFESELKQRPSTEVFQLNVQFFRLTEKGESK